MDAKTVFTLIIVTFGGDVKITRDIPSWSVCDEAASLAVWGDTWAAIKEEDKKIDEAIEHERERIVKICKTLPDGVACRPRVRQPNIGKKRDALLTTADPKFAKCVIEPSASLGGHQ